MERIRPILDANADRLIEPSIDGEVLRFDGDCETFLVTRKFARDFDFCKTNRGSYDDIVVACLLILAQEFREHGFTWQTDGAWPDEHEDGIALVGGLRGDLVEPTGYYQPGPAY